jgi:predicted MFS family arabinose efflux permease
MTHLINRQFRLLFAGQVLSGCGDWIDYVALISLVAYQWKAGAGGLAAVAVGTALPWLLLAPFAGVWADRLPQKRVMIACDLARAVLVVAYLAAPNLAVLLALLVGKTAFATLFLPAQQSLIKRMVPEGSLLAANALYALGNQLTKVAGPAAGGLLLVLAGGPRGAFVVDAGTFAASALILTLLRLPPVGESFAPRKERFRSELAEGVTFVLHSRTLLLAIGSLAATLFLVLSFDMLSPLILPGLGVPKSLFGPVVASVAAGAAIGTGLVARLGRSRNPVAVLGGSQAATGVLIALIGAAAVAGFRAPALSWLPFVAGIGLCSAGILVLSTYLIQRETPQALMGRVGSVAAVVPAVLQIAAPVVGATVAAHLGVGVVLAGAGGGLTLLGAACLLHSRVAPEPERHSGSFTVSRPSHPARR